MIEVTVTENNFEQEVLKSDKLVLLDFWAPWCGPCQSLAPSIKEIAEEHPEIKVAKINVDTETALSNKYNILGIPTLVLIKDGKVVQTSTGYMPKDLLEKFIQR